MKGYVVCVYKSISNEEKLKEYAVKARAAVEKYEGKFLIRGGKMHILFLKATQNVNIKRLKVLNIGLVHRQYCARDTT